jgi:2-polyprenyl-6-methoxyphenol hydroxylase-like FAD-dependent oxidoreductase
MSRKMMSACGVCLGVLAAWPGGWGRGMTMPLGFAASGVSMASVLGGSAALLLAFFLLRKMTAKAPYQYPRAPFAHARQPPSGTESIAVIGSGPAGSTFVMCAEKWGLPVTVYDRLAELKQDESSYINFKNVGLKALGEVDPTLETALRTNPTNLSPLTPIKTAAGETMVTINDPSAILLRRNELSMVITSHCKTKVNYGAEVVGVTESDTGIVVHFADGTSARHSFAVMCCGSRIRKVKSELDIEPKFYKKWVLRRVKDPDVAAKMPLHEQLFFGRAGKLIFTFPGEYLLISHKPIERGTTLTTEDVKREFAEFKGDVGAEFGGDLLNLVGDTEWHREKQYITWRCPPPKKWFSGRSVAIGDACHPMTPATGSGASMAVLDGIELACQLVKVDWWEPSGLEQAFATFQGLRETQIKQLWKIDSLRNGMNDMTNPVGVLLRDLVYGVVFKITTTLAKRRTLR